MSDIPHEWLTRAELSNWEETSRYPEVMDYCLRLQEKCDWIRYAGFGVSPQGRDLPLLIVSSQNKFTPKRAHRKGNCVILIINGIHSGEIAGKEASFMLLRDMAILKQKPHLLDHVTLLVVPVFSVDGHERSSPYNRINQNGPREMGWRATAQNLNLNRDWMKAEQPEMQSMLRLYQQWMPDLVIDNHVTDGGDYQYDITYIMDDHPRVVGTVRYFMHHYLKPYVEASLREKGHVATSYFEFKNANDPADGIISPPLSARFSDGYGTLQNRPTIVVETHSLKTFGVRIRAHYDLMEAVLERINREPEQLRMAVNIADAQTVNLGTEYRPDIAYPISVELDDSKSEPFTFEGIEYFHESSLVSGATKIRYGTEPKNFLVPYFHTVYADRTIAPPLGYLIPPEWIIVLERLSLHGVSFRLIPSPVTGEFETYRFTDVNFAAFPYEGRQNPRYSCHRVHEIRTLPAGSALVRLDQRCNRLILGLLEPESADSFVAWGFFNPIFEEKEYAEDYIVEKMAMEMLEKNETLRREFEERLQRDETFATKPDERLRFFYDRSPYRDQFKNAYPVVRITRRDQIPE